MDHQRIGSLTWCGAPTHDDAGRELSPIERYDAMSTEQRSLYVLYQQIVKPTKLLNPNVA
jgi:hypothetical protein